MPRHRARGPGLAAAETGKREAAKEGAMAEDGRRVGDRIADPWGRRTPYGAGAAWPVRVDQQLADGQVERWVPSACVLCSNGCGLDIGVAGGRIVGVRGRAGDRVNHGRLGPKGLYGWQANAAPDRLTRPLVREGGELVEASWDQAMDQIVARSRDLLETTGGGAFGFYTSGQRTSPRSGSGCTPSCSAAPAAAALGCCATSTTCT